MVRSRRSASARWLCGFTCTISGCSSASSSRGIVAITDVSVTFRMSSSVRTRVSSTSRSTATPKPSARPSTTPSARFRGALGDEGDAGGDALRTVLICTGETPPSGRSRSLTSDARLSAVELATSLAVRGSGLVTRMSMSELSSGELTEIEPASTSGVVGRSRCSITGTSTRGVVASSAYELT